MDLNKYIDHTVLKADTPKDKVLKVCEEAKQFDFASVCIPPAYIETVAKELKGTNVLTCTVIGFPLGNTTTETKEFETKDAIKKGAQEIDMVLNVGELKNQNYDYVKNDVEKVVKAAGGKTVKVILETCLLTKEEIKKACELCVEAKAHFVKTSTGFSTGGATIEDVKLMAETVNGKAKVKASGGVRTLDDANKMIEAGASRIGTSGGVSIVQGQESKEAY